MGGTQEVEKPPPFTVYYVYARQARGGRGWLEVGANAQGEAKGWIAAETAVDWKQALVLTFANPTGRLPTLFFDTKENLASLVENEALPTLAPQYVERTRAGSPPDGAGIVSIEPAEWIDFGQSFYLLPILDVEVFLSSAMRKVKLVEIASIPLQEEAPQEEQPFSAGIVFVIDTTTSMDPYIDRTRERCDGSSSASRPRRSAVPGGLRPDRLSRQQRCRRVRGQGLRALGLPAEP